MIVFEFGIKHEQWRNKQKITNFFQDRKNAEWVFNSSLWDEASGELISYFENSECIDQNSVLQEWVSCGLGGNHHIINWWSQSCFRNFHVVKHIGRMSPFLRGLIEHDTLASIGVYASKYIPLPPSFYDIKPDACVFLTGSWLYELQGKRSDYDLNVVGRPNVIGPTTLMVDNLRPHIHHCTEDVLAYDARQGKRWAWQILEAPNDCVIQHSNIMPTLTAMRNHFKSQDDYPGYFANGSKLYIDEFKGFFVGAACEQSDPMIRSWVAQKGWPYKLGYYMLLDCILSRWAVEHGVYDLREPFTTPEIRHNVLKCKEGLMTIQDWREIISPILPEGTTL